MQWPQLEIHHLRVGQRQSVGIVNDLSGNADSYEKNFLEKSKGGVPLVQTLDFAVQTELKLSDTSETEP